MSQAYETVIGLEVHAQLQTQTKIFCSSPNHQSDLANNNVCPVCLGMPGVLPVLNKKVVEMSIMAGLATHCSIREINVFARKQYFYPDLPKGYQISQFEAPICEKGYLDIEYGKDQTKRVGITRIHMEEDAGKTVHGEGKDTASYVDFNRASVPLIEIVSEPDMRSPEEAGAYLRELHRVLRYIDVCGGNMELGQFRCDANVSVRPVGQKEFGTRAELKNLNSFRNVEMAIEYEVNRQIAIINDGGTIVQETRLWDAQRGQSKSLRSKEESHDYRYFPDPDLPPLKIGADVIESIRKTLPEMPADKRTRYRDTLGLSAYDADVLTRHLATAAFFEQTLTLFNQPKKVANWIMGELMRDAKDTDDDVHFSISSQHLAQLLTLIEDGTISGKIAKEVFTKVVESGKAPKDIVAAEGMQQVSDTGELEAAIDQVLADNPKEVERYKAGDKKLTGFFVGQIMKLTKGKANPAMVNQLLSKKLGS